MSDLFGTLMQDARYAIRQLRRSPGFAAVAICSLAIGIGANVTIYSVAHTLLARQPDAARPDELVRVYRGDHSPLPRDWILYLAAHTTTMRALIAEDPLAVGLQHGEATMRVMASVVSENFFRDLGIGPSMGTVFAGAPGDKVGAVAVLSHDFWNAQLGADPTIVGRSVRINNQSFTVLGVAREGFHSSQLGWGPALFIPLSEQAHVRGLADSAISSSSMYLTARLAAGHTPANAQSELTTLAPLLPRASADSTRREVFKVERAHGITAEVRTQAMLASAFLMFVVGVVLLIACANLANLLLARAAARRREIAIRTALGVSRWRLVRQLLTESVAVSALGGAAGLALAWYATRLAPRLLPPEAPVSFDVSPDGNVLVFAVLLALVTGVLFGLAPALQASRGDVQGMLRSVAGASSGGARRSRARSAFLVGQVGLASVLLVTAALFLKGIAAAGNIDPGFRSERVVDLEIDLSVRQYDDARGKVFADELLRRTRALPQVESATLIHFVPLAGSNSGTGVSLPSADPSDRSSRHGTTFAIVAPGYFETMAILILRGRPLDAGDRAGSAPVAVVNESFARMMWPDGGGARAVGESIRMNDSLVTIVGVTRDTKYLSLNDRNVPLLYLPYTQAFSSHLVLQARLTDDTPAARAAVRGAAQALDPALPLGAVVTMDYDMRISTLPARIGAGLLGAFGALALLLATIGVYGVTAYLVAQRTAEIGIRSALGAPARSVLGLMMRDTVRLVLIGLGLGVAGGVGIGALISSWLYGVGALDPVSLAGASALLLTVSVLGTWLPARRALRVDPVAALRGD